MPICRWSFVSRDVWQDINLYLIAPRPISEAYKGRWSSARPLQQALANQLEPFGKFNTEI